VGLLDDPSFLQQQPQVSKQCVQLLLLHITTLITESE
jgi:hypothetical protein